MQMRIHNEGLIYFIVSLIVSFILLFLFPLISFFSFLISAYIFYFFRDPFRFIPNEDVIVSPADGIITFVGISPPPKELNISNKLEFMKISIFLNIFNVHVNRIPSNGVIEKIKYVHGKFINATLDKSSEDNERNIILIKRSNDDLIILTQIAGLIARRIVCNIKDSQEVIKGNRFGIIKFGSRVDLYMPKSYEPMISIGQTVIGGESIISNPNNIYKITNTKKN